MKILKLVSFFKYTVSSIQDILKKLNLVSVSVYAGQMAYFVMLSFFPFMMFLLAVLRHTPLKENELITLSNTLVPHSFQGFLSDIIMEIYNKQHASLLPVTIIMAIWLASRASLALLRALNATYHIEETRNYIILRALSMLYIIVFVVLLLLALTVLVFGNAITSYCSKNFPMIRQLLEYIVNMRSIYAFFILLLFFTFLYKVIPDRRTSFTSQLPGAILSSVGWILFSMIYSYYIDHISNYSAFYGTMTTIAFLMIWIYSCMYLLFLGGVLNYFLSKKRFADYLHFLRMTTTKHDI